MNKELIKEYYNLISMLSVSIQALSVFSEKKDICFISDILMLNRYIYNELLRFGLNNIGITEE